MSKSSGGRQSIVSRLKWLASLAFFSLSFVLVSAWAFPEPSMEELRSCIILNPFRLDLALICTHLYHSVQAWFSSNTTPLRIRIRHQIEYGFGYMLMTSPYIPCCIYLRGTMTKLRKEGMDLHKGSYLIPENARKLRIASSKQRRPVVGSRLCWVVIE